MFSMNRRDIPPHLLKYFKPRKVYKPKDDFMIPHRVYDALMTDGWFGRMDICWSKPSPMPESVEDRPTKSHEYIFLLSKSKKYFYDHIAVQEDAAAFSMARISQPNFANQTGGPKDYRNGINPNRSMRQTVENFAKNPGKRNRRSVWTVTTKPFKGAHFAVFPESLIEPCILAGSSEHGCCEKCGAPWERIIEKELVNMEGYGKATKDHTGNLLGSNASIRNGNGRLGDSITSTTGWQPTCKCNAGVVPCTVLDPFAGSGTTGVVSLKYGRAFIGIDLNASYLEMAEKRIYPHSLQRRLL